MHVIYFFTVENPRTQHQLMMNQTPSATTIHLNFSICLTSPHLTSSNASLTPSRSFTLTSSIPMPLVSYYSIITHRPLQRPCLLSPPASRTIIPSPHAMQGQNKSAPSPPSKSPQTPPNLGRHQKEMKASRPLHRIVRFGPNQLRLCAGRHN